MQIERNAPRNGNAPDLLVSPHIVRELMNIEAGKCHPEAVNQERMIAHLVECPFCETALLVLIYAEREQDRPSDEHEMSAEELLTRFMTLKQANETKKYEERGAYAEALVTAGPEKAAQLFPEFAEHLKQCAACEAAVDDLIAFLEA
jgi:hypothetical protein